MLFNRRLLLPIVGWHTIVTPRFLVGAWMSTSPSLLLHASFRSHHTALFTLSNNENNYDESITTNTSNNHTITWLTVPTTATNAKSSALMFTAYDGETLRTAALRRNTASPHNGRANWINCRGLGTCGTCAVEIAAGHVEPPRRNQIEQLRFQFPPFHNNTQLRLACQIQVKGDVQVMKQTGFWGQGQELATLSSPTKYLGDLEYVLDTKSPKESLLMRRTRVKT